MEPYLLMHMDDADLRDDGINNFAVTRYGDAGRSDAQSRFGGYALVSDGSEDFLSIGSASDWDFGTDDWTIDCWIYPTDLTGQRNILSTYDVGNTTGFILKVNNDDTIGFGDAAAPWVSSSSTVSINTWHHVAVVCKDGTAKVYLDGCYEVSADLSGGLSTPDNPLQVCRVDTQSSYNWVGYIDEVRIIKEAVWTSNFTPPISAYDDPWLGDWAHRIKIEIDNTNVDSALSNFPVLLYLSGVSGRNHADLTEVFDALVSDGNRKKIAVTTSDPDTQCYVEIEKWDDANEKAWLWVKVPSVSSGRKTVLFLYYDSSKSSNTSYVGDRGDTLAQSVWSAFELRYDMEDGTSSTVVDSTGNGHTGAKAGADQPEAAEQIIAQGQDFSSGDYIDIPDAPSDYFSGSWSIEAMYCNLSADEVLFTCGGGVYSWTDASGFYFYAYGHPTVYSDRLTVYFRNGDANGWDVLVSSVAYAADTWYHCVLTWDGTTFKLYVNGALQDSAGSLTAPTTCDLLAIGIDVSDYASYGLAGQVDEVRIAASALSAAWVKATYYSNIDNLVEYDADISELGHLLIHSDDSDGDTTFTNSGFGSAVISAAGDTHHEVDQSKFGASSIQFDGTGDYLTVSDNIIAADQDTFTIDCWIYPTASNTDSGRALVIGDSHVTQATSYWSFGRDTNDKLVFRWWDGSAKAALSTNTISLNAWTHIAVCVDSGSIKLFINGTEETLSGTTTLTNRTGTLGYLSVGQAYTNGFTGYIDELRLYDGAAWWDSSFTPRSTPWGAATETTVISAPIQFDFQLAARVSGGRIITAAPVQFAFRMNAVIYKLWGHKLNGVSSKDIESLYEDAFAFKYVEKINGV